MNRPTHHTERQQGAVLIISMVFLLLLTMVGLAGMRSAMLETRMTTNIHARMVTFEHAEAALRAGERAVAAYATPPPVITPDTGSIAAGGVWPRNAVEWNDDNWWAEHATTCCGGHILGGQSADRTAGYAVAYLGYVADTPAIGNTYGRPRGRHFYRITARATDAARHARVVLQSTFARRFP